MTIEKQRSTPDLIAEIGKLRQRVLALETTRRLGNSSIDSGSLTVRGGNITVRSDNDNVVTDLLHGSVPRIWMYPGDDAGSTDRAAITALRHGGQATLQLGLETIAGSVHNGGKILLQRNEAWFAVQPSSGGGAEAYYNIGMQGPELLRMQGKWPMNNQYWSSDAMVFGQDAVGAGFGGASYAFAVPFDNVPILLYSLRDSGTPVAHWLTGLDRFGFVISWASGSTAKLVNFVAFRV